MNTLTDEEWDRFMELLAGVRAGRVIEWHDLWGTGEWFEDDRFELEDLCNEPLRYRVKPETVTIYLYESARGITARTDKMITPPYPWRFMYSFEHEVQS